MSSGKIKKKTLFTYIAMTISLMGSCSLFQGKVGSLQWIFFYYGSVLILLMLSLYFISLNKNAKIRKERNFFIAIFCGPRIIMLIYSCLIWLATNTAFPYISRGISNTLFQCIAYFCGVCFACGEQDNILKVSLSSGLTVFGLAYLIGFVENGITFLSVLNPLSSAADNFRKFTELHELAYIVGLYILVNLIVGKHTSLKKENILFWLSIIVFGVAWKRIGIFAVILTYLYYLLFSRSKGANKTIFIKITGIVGTIICIIYVSLIVSGIFVELLESFGISLMGRNIIYDYFRRFASFSPVFLGKGLGFVGRQFDYVTSADLYNMVSIKALHNDFFKMYIEMGFVGFLIWVFWWLLKMPRMLQTKYGVEKTFILLLFIIYAFILYTTDNAESYTNFQLHLSALITYICCFYNKQEKKIGYVKGLN